MKKQNFNIIEFDSVNKGINRYIPIGLESSELWKDLVELDQFHSLMQEKMPIGKSRYGGCIVDFPKTLVYPEDKDLAFMGQIDLSEFKNFDKNNLLPSKGQIYFFMNHHTDSGKVIFFNGENAELTRKYLKDEDTYWGTLEILTNIRAATEKWQENYIKLEKEELKCTVCGEQIFLDCNCDNLGMLPYERYDIIERKYVWDFFAMTFKSKVFGIYTDVQLGEDEIEEITFSDKILLFQIGENINEEGVFSVLIDKHDLINRNFENCQFRWSQT